MSSGGNALHPPFHQTPGTWLPCSQTWEQELGDEGGLALRDVPHTDSVGD